VEVWWANEPGKEGVFAETAAEPTVLGCVEGWCKVAEQKVEAIKDGRVGGWAGSINLMST
jgi:hypothetical protein